MAIGDDAHVCPALCCVQILVGWLHLFSSSRLLTPDIAAAAVECAWHAGRMCIPVPAVRASPNFSVIRLHPQSDRDQVSLGVGVGGHGWWGSMMWLMGCSRPARQL
jgi:hypothetical protein